MMLLRRDPITRNPYSPRGWGCKEKSHGHDDDFSPTRGKWTDHPVFFQLLFFSTSMLDTHPNFFQYFHFFLPYFKHPPPNFIPNNHPMLIGNLLILNVIILEVFRTPPHLLGTGECLVVSCISTNMHI